MTNGCNKCAELEFGELCLDCQIEQADSDVCRAMNVLEQLRRKKEQLEKRRTHELDRQTRAAS